MLSFQFYILSKINGAITIKPNVASTASSSTDAKGSPGQFVDHLDAKNRVVNLEFRSINDYAEGFVLVFT